MPSRSTGRAGSGRAAWVVGGLVAIGVVADQATKATADVHVVNEAATAYLLPGPVRWLWADPHIGAVLDLLGIVPVVVLALMALRARDSLARVGWAVVLAGWASNWADRLGLSAVTQPGSARGAVDWIRVPAWPGVWNLADLLIVAGSVLVVAAAIRRSPRHRVPAIGIACVCLLALWVGVWSGDRRTEQSKDEAAGLRTPFLIVEHERAVFIRRVERARSLEAIERARTARAALVARSAGRSDAHHLLPVGDWFLCESPGRRARCVVVTSAGSRPRLVYPLLRPAWAAGVPLDACNRVRDQVPCETSAIRWRTEDGA